VFILSLDRYVATGVFKAQQLDNSLKVGFKAYNMAGGDYRMMFQRLLGPFCDMFYEDHMRPTIEEFFAATNLSYWTWGMCPLPSAVGFVKDYVPSQIGNYLPPYLPGGEKWKCTLYLEDASNTTIGGITIYASLRSNYSLMRYGG
jgi:hypothetical protein